MHKQFYPKGAGWSKWTLVEDILIRASELVDGYPEEMRLPFDDDHTTWPLPNEIVMHYAAKISDECMQAFVDSWYDWAMRLDELPDTAPAKQEELMLQLAKEIADN